MKHPVDVHVGSRVRQRRWMTGMTQQQLAERVGIKFQQIQKYETGMNRISASRLWDIAEALGVPVAFFFEGLQHDAAADLPPQVVDHLLVELVSQRCDAEGLGLSAGEEGGSVSSGQHLSLTGDGPDFVEAAAVAVEDPRLGRNTPGLGGKLPRARLLALFDATIAVLPVL